MSAPTPQPSHSANSVSRHCPVTRYASIYATTSTLRAPVGPDAYDCVTLAVIRDGSAIVCSQFGQRPIVAGDSVLLCTSTLCAAEPEGHITLTTVYIDTDYIIDQIFWKHVEMLSDRLDARELAKKLYVEPAQVLHLGERRAHAIAPWLDELVRLTTDERSYRKRFSRIQALWLSIIDIISPLIIVSPVRLSPSQRERLRPTTPRHRKFVPLRAEAMQAAELLRGDLARHWTAGELADRVHLSESQLSRVFADAYGKTPMTYLTMLRVEEIARLLRETGLLVEDAVGQVGWHNVSHAIRVFRAYVGMTPGVYRRTYNAAA